VTNLSATSWPEVIQAIATTVGSVGVVAALIYTARQTRSLSNQARFQSEEAERNSELQRANLEMRLMELTISIDKIFLDRPFLRPYFYENKALSWRSSRRRRAEVISIAETLIDFVDTIAGLRRHEQISDRNYENWRIFTESYYQQSPAVRELWAHWGSFFLPETAELFSEQEGPTDLHTEAKATTARERLSSFLKPSVPPFVPPDK
jgi:hypothetical protein